MTNNKQQTAVDSYTIRRHNIEIKSRLGKINAIEYDAELTKAEQQAKEMEKEQMIDAWSNGFDEDDRATCNPLNYYKQTYGGGEQ